MPESHLERILTTLAAVVIGGLLLGIVILSLLWVVVSLGKAVF